MNLEYIINATALAAMLAAMPFI